MRLSQPTSAHLNSCWHFSRPYLSATRKSRAKSEIRRAVKRKANQQERLLDPLEEALTDTWGDPEEGQWGYEYPSEEDFLDTVYQDRGTSEELTQGIVAVALTGLIIAASTTILWRIFVVAWALVAAALRYSVVALFLILIAAFLT
ncbi:hypothetical protein WJX84_008246 [Apatococcus fuscideae]|uniref:Uncharacterized protein n=1 Tax=Apatococcus fuscideae TaxID=2026836 RepID=A0AAW1SRL5_9CHLO